MVPLATMPDGPTIGRNAPEGPAIFSQCKHPDLAWEYIVHDVTRIHELFLRDGFCTPNSPKAAESPFWLDGLRDWESAEIYDIAATMASRSLVHVPRLSEIDRIIQAAFDSVLLGQATAADAMTQAKAEVDVILQEQS
jgi:ABC-type glycerol-3-phosphate transport system substrate-binding protein